jgi:hypothetical protein
MTSGSIGRNDPCPCGSGKKYKKCHGQNATNGLAIRPDVARANLFKKIDIDLGKRLLDFARKERGRHWLRESIDAYLGMADGELPEADFPLALPWATFSHFDEATQYRTLAEEWRIKHRTKVDSDTATLLDAYTQSWLSIWEVASIEPGVGVKLVDQLTREERFVLDVASSETLQPFDTLLAFVLDCDGVSFFGGVHGHLLPPHEAADVVKSAREVCRVRTRAVAKAKLQEPDIQLELIDLWRSALDEMFARPMPTLTNTDGDPFSMTTDEYELLAPRGEIVRAVQAIDGVEAPEEDGKDLVFVVAKSGNAQHKSWDNTVIGRIVLTSHGRLRVETNSVKRADALRATLERSLPGLVRYRLRSEANMNEMLIGARDSGGRTYREPELAPPEIAAQMREFREQHMTQWLDDSIPALGGASPRAAAKDPKRRGALELLLKSFENSEARLPEQERIDIARLRAELGMRTEP